MLNERSEKKIENFIEVKEYIYKKDTPDAARLFITKIPESAEDFLQLANALCDEDEKYEGRKVSFFVPQKSLSADIAYPYRLKCAAAILQDKILIESTDKEIIRRRDLLSKIIEQTLEKIQLIQEQDKQKEKQNERTLFYSAKNAITSDLQVEIRPDNKQKVDELAHKWVDFFVLHQSREFYDDAELRKAKELHKEIDTLGEKLKLQKPVKERRNSR